MGRIGGGLDTEVEMNHPKKTEVVPALVRAIHLSPLQIKKTEGGSPLRKERELDPLMMEPPRTVEGIELVIRGDSTTVMRYKKCGPVEGSNSLDAELGGCAMLIESLKFWLQKAGSRLVVVRI